MERNRALARVTRGARHVCTKALAELTLESLCRRHHLEEPLDQSDTTAGSIYRDFFFCHKKGAAAPRGHRQNANLYRKGGNAGAAALPKPRHQVERGGANRNTCRLAATPELVKTRAIQEPALGSNRSASAPAHA